MRHLSKIIHSKKDYIRSLPLCIPVNLSLRTVNSYIFPKFSNSGLSSFSSKFRGIWPIKSLIASWSFVGLWLSQLFWLTLNCRETGSTNPFTSVAMLIIRQHAFWRAVTAVCTRFTNHNDLYVKLRASRNWFIPTFATPSPYFFLIRSTIFKCRRS